MVNHPNRSRAARQLAEAAPELLAAAKDCSEWLTAALLEVTLTPRLQSKIAESVDRANAAIAKATGAP